MNNNKLIVAGLFVAMIAKSNATWYTSEASFDAAIQAGSYTEGFSGFTRGNPLNGTQTSYVAPGANGFGWTASAPGGLWSEVNALSTANASDLLTIGFTGKPVTAFAAMLGNLDNLYNFLPGTAQIMLSDGESQTVALTSSPQFLGWVGASPVTSAVLSTTSSTPDAWVTAGHVITGSTVPEPASIVTVAVGALALLRRRRRVS